uniref:GTP-binding protein REM 1 isoform X2 n=1 Tax=Scatophagus argus TaxID=75038 RepID=UPI001ED86072|nr:GTP-binding protein REM 1 isoform X2 [Scatophagus argus]
MTLNTQREKVPLQRRGSTPIPPAYNYQHPSWNKDPQLPGSSNLDPKQPCTQRNHPPLVQSASYHPGDKSLHYRAQWSSDSEDDSQSDSECVYRVVLLGDHGVGKTSLAGIFAGITEKDEQPGEDTYERTLTVDGEETTLIVMDTWENEKLERDDASSQDDCLKIGSAYVIVYSVTDRSSFDSASELRITLRRARQAENLPIILVGNKSDLVRSREVAVEGGGRSSQRRAERVQWFLTVSSLRHQHLYSTMWPSCSRALSDRFVSVEAAVKLSSADAPFTSAKRALPRRLGASWTDW